jgi:hypothetical protein
MEVDWEKLAAFFSFAQVVENDIFVKFPRW